MTEFTKELRSSDLIAQADDKRIISGYALKFGTASNLLQSSDGKMFYETITPQAITEQFLYTQDVRCYYNHDENSLLARFNKGKGTLSLSADSVGLFYSFKAKNTALDEQIYQSIKVGDVTGSSFTFSVAAGGDTWTKNSNGTYNRSINKLQTLFDVCPVNVPAYDSSNVNARHMTTGDLTAYYADLSAQINNDEDLITYFEEIEKELNSLKNL